LRILSEVGLEVASDTLAHSLAGKGLLSGGRARISPDVAEAYAADIRQRFGGPLDVTPVVRPALYNLPPNPRQRRPRQGSRGLDESSAGV